MKPLLAHDPARTKFSKLDGSACRALQQLRGAVEKESMAPSLGCGAARAGGGGGGGGRPLVARLPLTHHAQLHTLADLLDGCPKADPFAHQDTKMKAVSKCRGCDSFTLCSLLFGYEEQENTLDIEKLTPTALHVACLLPQPGPLVTKMVGVGVAVNEPNVLGQTPLHALLLGDVRSTSLVDALCKLLAHGADVSVRDNAGETPLHLVRNLLRQGLYQRAAQVAKILLQAGAQVDAANNEGRTLLTYSVEHLDDSLPLTRALFNHGASAWGAADGTDKDQSVFTWFLKAVITHRRVENCAYTVAILSHMMADNPHRMHQHVLRTMFRQSRCYKVLGPVFLELKTLMMPHWTQPPTLTFLCWRTVRHSLTPKRIQSGAPQLGLPPPLESYILLGEPGNTYTSSGNVHS
ncbi:uncharacterized protein LOC123503816 isoform X2 [Portunus trituberculatus]|uniref:uncharacterized protein LOC123503816 isoform X2 n=1 Tax=Portunus trituberculatus TaxID=210409 RepID=UPI001E1CEF6D|nr:uncharacterized protein LOC123503816 isoform X2 [Portunus trituberculatus]